jgi:choline kinase
MNVILAAGNQERWNIGNDSGYKIKQLIEIDGKTLIERIQDQFDGCVITHNEHIINHSKYFARPEKYRWTIETLLSSQAQWSTQTIVLLGDVYYSNSSVKEIKEFSGGLMFFGTTGEIFAISFKNHEFVRHNLERAVYKHERDLSLKHDGRLWAFYRMCSGLKIKNHKFNENNFTFIDDETQDFDSIEDYHNFLR